MARFFNNVPNSLLTYLISFVALFNLAFVESASGAGPSPKFNVGCFDYSTTGLDSLGRYIEYQPTVTANFYGKKATIRTYLNEVLTNTLKFSRNSSSYSRVERFDVKARFYEDQVSLGKNEFKFVFRDSRNRGSTWICETELYETSFGRGLSGSGFGVNKIGCSYNGIRLYGRVQIVDYFPDLKVQIVNYFPDLNVQKTDYFPTSCGKWQFVDYFPDFTVQFVNYFPDLKIRFVDYFPGIP